MPRTGISTVTLLLLVLVAGAPDVGAEDLVDRVDEGAWQPRQRSIREALVWLQAHQSPTGAWEAARFAYWANGKPQAANGPVDAGNKEFDVGVTGLALCAFLGAGYAGDGPTPFDKVVKDGLGWLLSTQDSHGCYGPRREQRWIYNHAFAALAMTEAFRKSGDRAWQQSAQRALKFHEVARNPYFAWRYGIKPGDNDTSVTTAMLLALNSARRANEEAKQDARPLPFAIPTDAFAGAQAWLDKMMDRDHGRIGYIQRGGSSARMANTIDRFPTDRVEAGTAMGIVAYAIATDGRATTGTISPREKPKIAKSVRLCLGALPEWDVNAGTIDMIYWFYGTLVFRKIGREHWRTWSTAAREAIVRHQRRDTTRAQVRGSWDPSGPWGTDGGRVYSTALMCLCCEVLEGYDDVAGLLPR